MADLTPNLEGVWMGKDFRAAVRGVVAQVDAIAERCGQGMATKDDAQYLREKLVTAPWMTYQGADMLQLHADRIERNGGNEADRLLLTRFSAWARKVGGE